MNLEGQSPLPPGAVGVEETQDDGEEDLALRSQQCVEVAHEHADQAQDADQAGKGNRHWLAVVMLPSGDGNGVGKVVEGMGQEAVGQGWGGQATLMLGEHNLVVKTTKIIKEGQELLLND